MGKYIVEHILDIQHMQELFESGTRFFHLLTKPSIFAPSALYSEHFDITLVKIGQETKM